jgi:hypothetical protein
MVLDRNRGTDTKKDASGQAGRHAARKRNASQNDQSVKPLSVEVKVMLRIMRYCMGTHRISASSQCNMFISTTLPVATLRQFSEATRRGTAKEEVHKPSLFLLFVFSFISPENSKKIQRKDLTLRPSSRL